MSIDINNNEDKNNETSILKRSKEEEEEEEEDDEGFSIISDNEEEEEEEEDVNVNNGDNGDDKENNSVDIKEDTDNTKINMEVEEEDDEEEDEGFSIISDDDDDNIDTAGIDGSNELDFIRGIERSDPKKMTKAIIENAQKLMTEQRDKLAQEVTDAMLAEASSSSSFTHKDNNQDIKQDNNTEQEQEEQEEQEEENDNNTENDNVNTRFLQQKARELNKIDQNLKALEELCAGEYSETPTPSSTPTEAIADAINAAATVANEGAQIQAGEDERAYLIRIGKITPFADQSEMQRKASELGCSAIDGSGKGRDGGDDDDDDDDDEVCNTGEEFFGDGAWKDDGDVKVYRMRISKWKRNVLRKLKVKENITNDGDGKRENENEIEEEEEEYVDEDDDDDDYSDSKLDDILIEDSDDEAAAKSGETVSNEDDTKIISEEDFIEDNDDNNSNNNETKTSHNEEGEDNDIETSEDIDEKELFRYFQGSDVKDFGDGFSVPLWVHKRLYGYQRVGVQWLWELHKHESGGILGDEMGLGKTVTVATYLASLFSSGRITAPVLVVCPATLMTQWAHEFHAWCAPVRVVILHGSGTAGARAYDLVRRPRAFEALGATVFLTTYEGVRIHQATLTRRLWSYVVLDEGHKIKNPDSMVTLACKNFKTPHRLIMSGTPIQNSLRELWSLFDFVKPHLLGTLPVFYTYFIRPISAGSFANASGTQAQVAFNASSALHHAIDPYLLRRVKRDVLPQLPRKREEVLLCALTKEQAALYRSFLRGAWMEKIEQGKLNMLFGVDVLRKICNHPDLVLHPQKAGAGREWVAALQKRIVATAQAAVKSSSASDALFRSGKLRVTRQLLRLWDRTGHKALLFCQTRQMLNIVEASVSSLGIQYLRMDGMTSMKARPALISRFNADPAVKIFLLTTKVGGLGVNLTAADRVIIYDPDWNPAVDEQARERVLRIGQKKEVCIYRLLTAGTIEEKVYHRQLFKQSLQNSVLNDVRQKRLFREEFLKQLFSFNPDVDKKKNLPDTAKIFQNISQNRHDDENEEEEEDEEEDDSVKIQNESDISKIRDNWVPPKPDNNDNDNDNNDGNDGNGNGNEKERKEDKKKKTRGRGKKESETSILKNILSVIDQETITDQDMITKAEDLKANAEASSIVHEMLRSFSFMRKKIKDGDKFTPTWTGSHGKTGMPEKVRKKSTGASGSSGSGAGSVGRGRMFGAVKSNAAAPSSSAVLDNVSKRYTAMQSSPSPTPAVDRAKQREKERERERKRIARKKAEAPKMNPGEFDLFNPPALPPPPPRPKPKEKRVHELDNVKPLILQQHRPMLPQQKRMAQVITPQSSSSSKRQLPPPPPQSTTSAQQKKSSKPPPPKVLKITDFFSADKKMDVDEPIPAANYPSEPVKFAEKVFIDLTKYFMENDGTLPTEKIIKKFKYVVGEDAFKIRLFKKTLESMSVLNINSKTWCLKDI